jgi:oxygen-dependent protoporphyrinogen oxidase
MKRITGEDLFSHIESANIGLVNLSFKGQVLPHQGFGFLVPSAEEHIMEEVLGVVFDSSAFPHQCSPQYTRLTMMSGGHLYGKHWSSHHDEAGFLIERAQKVCRDVLGITAAPVHSIEKRLLQAIPQYRVGHKSTVDALTQAIGHKFHGRLRMVGSWKSGVAINQCIYAAKQLVESMDAQKTF